MLKINLSKFISSHGLIYGKDIICDEGEILWFQGKNGVGKTTMFKLIEENLTNIFFLEQSRSISFYPRTLGSFLRIWTDQENVDQKKCDDLFKSFELCDKSSTLLDDLSAGEIQLVKLSMCFSYKAKIYLLDEPFQNLHESFYFIVNQEIASLTKEKRIVLLVDHEGHVDLPKIKKIKLNRKAMMVDLEAVNE